MADKAQALRQLNSETRDQEPVLILCASVKWIPHATLSQSAYLLTPTPGTRCNRERKKSEFISKNSEVQTVLALEVHYNRFGTWHMLPRASDARTEYVEMLKARLQHIHWVCASTYPWAKLLLISTQFGRLCICDSLRLFPLIIILWKGFLAYALDTLTLMNY